MKQKSIGLFAATFLSLGLVSAGSAEAITFSWHWTGQPAGYQLKGSFSYDENAFDIAFIDPNCNVFKEFLDNHLTSPDFNFNFDTNTKEILQTGPSDADNGISIGGEKNVGLNFFSAPNPMTELFDDDDPSPHVHLTDWGNEFPGLPIGFTRGARPHLDIAFFTRTRTEVLDIPNSGEELGQF